MFSFISIKQIYKLPRRNASLKQGFSAGFGSIKTGTDHVVKNVAKMARKD
jgi:hypothetical protein